MAIRISPGGIGTGAVEAPGDRSIATRWLILGVTARGRSTLRGIPRTLDVVAMLSCLAAVSPRSRASLEAMTANPPVGEEPGGFTWDDVHAGPPGPELALEGEGWDALSEPSRDLDCMNSGTTMRLLAGLLSSRPFRSRLIGDASLSRRPMDRVAEPLRAMGADVRTADGHAPLDIRGGPLRGIVHRTVTPSAQVKGALLFAGLRAEGQTTVMEAAATRDHSERVLAALGAPVVTGPGSVTISSFQHDGFVGEIPGDVSSAAFLIGAAVLSGRPLRVRGVGLNPTRTRFLGVIERMGVRVTESVEERRLGEPVGSIGVEPQGAVRPVSVPTDELPVVIDEVPILAVLAANASGESRFAGAGELRVKEADRLEGLAEGIRSLGGRARVEGDDLIVGGGGLAGGRADALGDHRLAMAFAIGGVAAGGPCEIQGMQAAAVSFPGFVATLRALGADIEALT